MTRGSTRNGRTSNADRVYEVLRLQLLRGELPVGQRLVEQTLAAHFETSRTPVREALRRLEGDGHLVRDPAGGLKPAPPSVRSMRELYDVRIVLEELVVRRVAAAGPQGDVDALAETWRTLRGADAGPEFVDADEAFHRELARCSGNAEAARILEDVGARIRILRVHDFTSLDRVRATVAEHLEILDAVLAADADAAAAFMRAHVQRSSLVVRERVGEALSRMFEPGD